MRPCFRLPASRSLAQAFAQQRFVVVHHFLPAGITREWAAAADRLSRQYGTSIRREGRDRLAYTVVPGDIIRDHWPDLYAFYASDDVRAWVRQVTGAPAIFTSAHLASAININRLETTDHAYRWHYDATPFTLLIYLTDSAPDAGGALQVEPPHGAIIDVQPTRGMAVLMDGTVVRHRVAPIQRAELRLSIPLVYPATPEHHRPPGLDEYLYASEDIEIAKKR
jgi:hypothetical protein